ncbi:PstS family phosphate ABC transporter substrate-binding protein [Sphingobacterium lactis]|uniref:PstS family phosphate ABC transporter substrate-binding protein n=1 Tax=Sphingobacterium lactis TaxID=797291 RepID=UPI003DA31430
MKRHKQLIYSILLLFVTNSCAPKVEQGFDKEKGYMGTISISGAFALYPLAVLWAEDFKKIHPHVRFNISAGGAGKGISDVLTNMVDIGLVSRDLHAIEIERGALPIVVANDAVLGSLNSAHPNIDLLLARGISQEELKGIFLTRTIKTWKQLDARFVDEQIEVYVRSDAAGAAETWAKYLGASQEDLQGIGIFGDPGLAQAIKDHPLAIGFNNINYIYDLKSKKPSEHIVPLPLDINGNRSIEPEESCYSHLDSLTRAVATGKYPAPPARELMFVLNKQHTSKLLEEFVRFVMTEKQQAYLLENGFVPLDKQKIEEENNKIHAREL